MSALGACSFIQTSSFLLPHRLFDKVQFNVFLSCEIKMRLFPKMAPSYSLPGAAARPRGAGRSRLPVLNMGPVLWSCLPWCGDRGGPPPGGLTTSDRYSVYHRYARARDGHIEKRCHRLSEWERDPWRRRCE